MSYADIHPVHSPYSPRGGGPVSIEVGGRWEEEEEVRATPYDEHMEWDIQEDSRELGRDRSVATRDDRGHEWSEMEWETTSHEPAQGSSIVLCLDTNTLIRHLPLIISLHSLLLAHSTSSSSPPPISFLIPTTVLSELDGLKSSRKPVQSTLSSSSSSPSIHASTIGTLAQRANHWLLDQKRKERVDGCGRGIFFVKPPPISGPATNDDRILHTALLVRSMPSSSGQPPQILLWTSDVNFSLKSEAEGIETMGSGSRIVPRTPIGLLQMLGLANDAPPPPPPPPSTSQPCQPTLPSSSVGATGDYEGGDGMEIDDDAVIYGGGREGGVNGDWDPSPRGSFRRLLEGCVPLALDRRLADIRRVNSALLDNAGLPSEPPPRSWRLDQCFDALCRIWGNDKGRWEGRDLGVFKDRRVSSSSPPSPPTISSSPSNISIHAPRSSHQPPLSPSFTSPLHPPSPKHVREVLLPILSSFFSVASWSAPSEEEWVEVLKAVEIVLGGPGGRRFLGEGSWKEVLEGIEKGWEEVKVVRRREMGFDD